MTEITILPEALEAAARAICETEYGPCDGGGIAKCECTYWQSHALAAIRAALAAWPGGVKNYSWDASHGRIILPLPPEKTDE